MTWIRFKARAFWPLIVVVLSELLFIIWEDAFQVVDAIQDSYSPALNTAYWIIAITLAVYMVWYYVVEDIIEAFAPRGAEPAAEFSQILPDDRMAYGTLEDIEDAIKQYNSKHGHGDEKYWRGIRAKYSGISPVIVMHANNMIKNAERYARRAPTPA